MLKTKIILKNIVYYIGTIKLLNLYFVYIFYNKFSMKYIS